MTRPTELRTALSFRAGGAPPAVAPALPEARAMRPSAPAERDRASAVPSQRRAVRNVSIHAFCEATATAEAMQAAAADRRLAKARVEVATGGIDAAVAAVPRRHDARAQTVHAPHNAHGTAAPGILVVETSLPRPLLLARLDALKGRSEPGIRLILIGQHNDIGLYRELMRRDVAEYLIAPVSPAQLVEAIAGVSEAADGTPGRVIAFIGAKGGTGSSTVCHNVAWALSEALKLDTVVADLDLAFGTAALDFNQEAVQGIAEALQAPERLNEAAIERLLTRCSRHLSLLAAPAALDRDYDVSAGACGTVLEALRQQAAFVAVDLPHLWTPWIRQVLVQADEIVITAAADLANLRNAKNIVDVLEAARPATARLPHLVVNMARRLKRPDIDLQELTAALDLEPDIVIDYDAETFALAANNGQMIEECARKARAAPQLRSLALMLAEHPAPKEPAWTSPLAPFLGRLRLRA